MVLLEGMDAELFAGKARADGDDTPIHEGAGNAVDLNAKDLKAKDGPTDDGDDGKDLLERGDDRVQIDFHMILLKRS